LLKLNAGLSTSPTKVAIVHYSRGPLKEREDAEKGQRSNDYPNDQSDQQNLRGHRGPVSQRRLVLDKRLFVIGKHLDTFTFQERNGMP